MHKYKESIVGQARWWAAACLDGLASQVSHGTAAAADFDRARAALEALPLGTAEFTVALNRLENARRYLEAAERGAARYELRLLLGSLRGRKEII